MFALFTPLSTCWNCCALYLGWVSGKSQSGGCKKYQEISPKWWASTPQRHIHDTHWPSINLCFCDPLHAPTSRQANWTKKTLQSCFFFSSSFLNLRSSLPKQSKCRWNLNGLQPLRLETPWAANLCFLLRRMGHSQNHERLVLAPYKPRCCQESSSARFQDPQCHPQCQSWP